MKLILRIIASTIAVFVTANIIPGVNVEDLVTALIVAIVLGLLNTFLKPILVILTLPVTIFTLGFFYLIINALIVLLAAQIVPGFTVDSIIAALLFSFVSAVINFFLNAFTK